MKKQILALFTAIFMIGVSGCQSTVQTTSSLTPQSTASSAARAQPVKDIAILYTNDVHCAVEGDIGYAGVAAYKNQLQADGNEV